MRHLALRKVNIQRMGSEEESRELVMAIGILAVIGFVFGPLAFQAGTEGFGGVSREKNQSSPQESHAKNETACGLDDPCPPGENRDLQMPATPQPNESQAPQSTANFSSHGAVCLHYWYSPGCSHCTRVKDHLHTAKRGRYPNLEIREHNAKQDMDVYNDFLSHYQVPEPRRGKVPVVYLGERYCIGDEECLIELPSMMEACFPDGCVCQTPEKGSALKVGLVGVASLAAVDAVNVCALAVLLILLTAVLTKFPENRKKMLIIAFAFMAGIFTAYFVVGVLIVLGFKSLAGLGSLSTSWVYKAVGIVAILLGVFNLKDGIWYGGGGFKLEVPEIWRPRMKGLLGAVISPQGSYVVGLIVSMFLLPCALGPYFVASGLLAGLPVPEALAWLVLYNIVFILPMMVITFAVYGGFAAIKNIEEWRQNNLKTLHVVAGLILCSIGGAIVAGFI
jgi:hypothetical protein